MFPSVRLCAACANTCMCGNAYHATTSFAKVFDMLAQRFAYLY